MKMYKNRLEEGYPTVKLNHKILDKLPGKTYTINAIDQIPTDSKYPAL